MNIAIHMERAGKKHGAQPAIAYGVDVVFNYEQLANRVAGLASGLRAGFDLKEGQRVALYTKNSVEFIEAMYAVWHAGAVVVPINAKLHVKEAAFILENCDASICFVEKGATTDFEELGIGCQIIELDSSRYNEMLKSTPIEVCYRAPEDPAWIFYTSGTTGAPKGATLSFRNLLTMTYCHLTDIDPEAPWETLLHAAPMSHGSGLIALAYVMQGGCHVIPASRGYDTEEILGLIETWPNTTFFAAPTMVKRLVEYPEKTDTSNLKVIIYGGGPMYLEHCKAGLKKFGPKLAQLYGQGESPMTITALNRIEHTRKDVDIDEHLSSVGTAQSAVQVRIVDEQGGELPIGEIGEVAVRGDTVMLGYWNDPEATSQAIREGWLMTGDHGTMNEDGLLTLKDRSKDLIISGGSNIYPREVEEVLLESDLVEEVSVIGRPDAEWGEIVVAYIVPGDGHREPDQAILDGICTKQIARFKRPKEYQFVESLPKNNYGKVLKSELRKIDAKRSISA